MSGGPKSLLAEAIVVLRERGLATEIEPGNGSHRKIKFTNANGSKCFLVVPRMSGSWRQVQNTPRAIAPTTAAIAAMKGER
jgi:hypothetical protein